MDLDSDVVLSMYELEYWSTHNRSSFSILSNLAQCYGQFKLVCRCMDLDGDGVLSMYELEYFYEEQLQRMEQLGIETLPFDDCLCQVSSGLFF